MHILTLLVYAAMLGLSLLAATWGQQRQVE